jgi:deoxyadenosine/deoxycytidine kinase
MAPLIVSVEGNIGSGKSTFVEILKQNLETISNRPIVFLQEPVDEWRTIVDKQGEGILSKFYANQEKYSFAFQMMAYISRLALLKKTVEENPDAIIITERCLYTDKYVFAKMLYDSNLIEEVEYAIYLKWFNTFQEEYPISGYVYLYTKAETAFERVKKRSRDGESTIPLDYLRQCHQYHNEWLFGNKEDIDEYINNDSTTQHTTAPWLNILLLDAEEDIEAIKKRIPLVESFIQKKL